MTREIRPYLFLDVDGVVAPYDGEFPLDTWPDFAPVDGGGFRLRLSRTMADRLAELPVDLVWLTTWEQQDWCNTIVGRALGWDPFPVARSRSRYGWWKLHALIDYVEADRRPFIWCDDDLDAYKAEARALLDRRLSGVPRLLSSPPPLTGITPQHVDVFSAWLDERSVNGSDRR